MWISSEPFLFLLVQMMTRGTKEPFHTRFSDYHTTSLPLLASSLFEYLPRCRSFSSYNLDSKKLCRCLECRRLATNRFSRAHQMTFREPMHGCRTCPYPGCWIIHIALRLQPSSEPFLCIQVLRSVKISGSRSMRHCTNCIAAHIFQSFFCWSGNFFDLSWLQQSALYLLSFIPHCSPISSPQTLIFQQLEQKTFLSASISS